VIDKNKITRWHPEFDVESVMDIIPSTLPKIEIHKPKLETAKDLLGNIGYIFLKYLHYIINYITNALIMV